MYVSFNRYIFLYSDTGNSIHLTTTSNSDPYAQVILVEDPRYSPVNRVMKGYWRIEAEDGANIWGLDIKLDGEKYGFINTSDSQVEILMDIYRGTNELDIFTAFSVNDRYFANINDIDGGSAFSGYVNKQGIYPSCGSSLTYQTNLFTVFETYSIPTYALTLGTGNWSVAYNKTNGADGLHIFSITNDAMNNKAYFQFNSPTIEYSCMFNDSFDLYSDIHFYFRNDEDKQESKVYSVDIINRY